jgi:hypothetical protein
MSGLVSVAFCTCDAMGHVSPLEPSSVRQWEPSIMGHTAAPESLRRGDHAWGH